MRSTISESMLLESEPVPVGEVRLACSKLLRSDEVRELLMLLTLDMGFPLSLPKLSDGPGNT